MWFRKKKQQWRHLCDQKYHTVIRCTHETQVYRPWREYTVAHWKCSKCGHRWLTYPLGCWKPEDFDTII